MFLHSNMRKSPFQLSQKIGFRCGDVQRLASRFAPEPLVQRLGRSCDKSALAADYSHLRPSLHNREWLTEEAGDLPPAFEHGGLRLGFGFPFVLRIGSRYVFRQIQNRKLLAGEL
jgi:hypothetical protein